MSIYPYKNYYLIWTSGPRKVKQDNSLVLIFDPLKKTKSEEFKHSLLFFLGNSLVFSMCIIVLDKDDLLQFYERSVRNHLMKEEYTFLVLFKIVTPNKKGNICLAQAKVWVMKAPNTFLKMKITF